MKTQLALNAPWPQAQAVESKPKPKAPPKETKKRATPVKKSYVKSTRTVTASFDEDGNLLGIEPLLMVWQQRIAVCHAYTGRSAVIFNEGFKAAEVIYGIDKRKWRGT